MGLSSSTVSNNESNDHFAEIVNPKKVVAPVREEEEDAFASTKSDKNNVNKKAHSVCLDVRAGVIKKVDCKLLWENFLKGSYMSFALTQSEATSLLKKSIRGISDATAVVNSSTDAEIALFIELLEELSEKDFGKNAKVVDFMALCSSTLLLADNPIEYKIEWLYQWITMSQNCASFDFKMFFVAMRSFERGLSYAFGKASYTEESVRAVTRDWFALADPNHRGAADEGLSISADNFFDFCSNRQHVVRRLLESLSLSEAVHDTSRDIEEAVVNVAVRNAILAGKPTGGDEWMANPAWKKTAERMVPAGHEHINVKPTSNLQLEWVHGYRGYDCRNNLRYIDMDGSGTQVLFHAAALGVVQCETDEVQSGSKHDNREQFFFGEHGDDIISLAVHEYSTEGRKLIATGDIGKHPVVYLYEWDSAEKLFVSLTSMRGFHTSGVCQMSFSHDGMFLFTVGADYTIAIYDSNQSSTQFGKMIASSKGPKDKVLHCTSLPDGSFVSCGEKHVIYWSHNAGRIVKEEVKLHEHKRKLIMCVASLSGSTYAAGTSDGDILLFDKAILNTKVMYAKVHKKSVNSLWTNASGSKLLSGGSDGKVVIWAVENAKSLTRTQEFSLTGCNYARDGPTSKASSVPPVRSVCLSGDGSKCLVGTQSCEIIEYAVDTALTDGKAHVLPSKVLLCGHFKDELWGLGIRPMGRLDSEAGKDYRPEYCTVGDDGVLRIWDLFSHKQKNFLDMKAPARCCAYSPDGEYLAVGFGGTTAGRKSKNNGAIRIFRGDTLLQVCETKEAKQWISCMKFSPDGHTLAVGARDNSIYVYSVTQQFKRKSKFSKHNAGILDFDFSADGKYLQSTCSAYELLFSDAATGAQLTNGATFLADESFATYTCTLGWPVIGVWSGSMDGSDVNSADRSPSGKLVATGDDFGKVNCYKYPCTLNGGAPKTVYAGHSSHVTSVRWVNLSPVNKAPTDNYLISLGGGDKTIMQWKVVGIESSTSDGAVSETQASNAEEHHVSILDEAPSGGDEFMAVKAWLGAIKAPSAWATPDVAKKAPFYAAIGEMGTRHRTLREASEKEVDIATKAAVDSSGSPSKTHKNKILVEDRSLPTILKTYADVSSAAATVMNRMSVSGEIEDTQPDGDELELEWVHGFTSNFSNRNNVFYTTSSQASSRFVIYKAAGLGIVVEINEANNTKTQRYFKGHTDDITSMAYMETSSQAIVATGQIGKGNTFVWEVPSMKTLGILKTGQKTVNLLRFSQADGGRILVSIAQDSSICVSDWKSQTVLARVNDNSVSNTFHICASSFEKNFSFFTCGNRFITHWSLSGRNLSSSKVSTSKLKGVSSLKFLCVAEVKRVVVVGCENGLVYAASGDSKALMDSFSATDVVKANKNAVLSIKVDDARNILLTGSKDGSVSLFDTSNMKLDLVASTKKDRRGKISSGKVETFVAPTLLRTFKVQSIAPGIHAAQVYNIDYINDRLVIGTLGADVLEFQVPSDVSALPTLVTSTKDPEFGFITRGHCYNELWGLATHPLLPEYATCGDDMILRTFSVVTKKILSTVSLGAVARACDYNSDGSLIAVGFGGRLGRGKEPKGGMVRLYRGNCSGKESPQKTFFGQNHFKSSDKLSDPLAQAHDAKLWISVVRFSADGSTLAVGSHDCKIYVYNVEMEEDLSSTLPATGDGMPRLRVAKGATLTLRCTFRKHNSVINHIDLSANGRYMQSNCSAYELLFCDTMTGSQVTSASELKDVAWDTWTCTLGWPVQGIWSQGMDGSDINSVSRSASGHLIATADDFGKIRLFRYPAVTKGAACLSYSGHSSHVMNVSWTAGDECLVSCGGNDKCVMQWKHIMTESTSGGEDKDKEAAAGIFDDSMTEDLMLAKPTGGDESGAVKPWLGAVRTPKVAPVIDSSEPAVSVKLEWVHGYTSGSSCNTRISKNLWYASDGNPVYPAAALGVKLIKDDQGGQKRQMFFRGHNDDVLCLAVSADRRFVATGQVANTTSHGKGSICIWDSRDCRELSRMDGCHQRAVTSLAFSPDGSQLISIGQDNKNTHKLWTDIGGNWCRVQCTATAVSDQSTVFFSHWLKGPHESDCALVSGGAKNINFWKLEGATLVKKQGRFGRKYKQCPLLCAANLQTTDEKGGSSRWCLTVGTSTGGLYSFDNREITSGVENAHKGPILCLAEGNVECTFLVSGGMDSIVRVWNQALQNISFHDISKLCVCDAGIGSLDVRPFIEGFNSQNDDLVVLVGTTGGDIVELTSSTTGSKENDIDNALDISGAHECVLLSSHSQGELWGLAVHPTNPDLFVTVGDDSSLRIWSIKKQKMLYNKKLPHPARSVAWAVLPDDGLVDDDEDAKDAKVGPRELIAVGFMEEKKSRSHASKGKKSHESHDPSAAHHESLHLYKAALVKGNYELTVLATGGQTSAWVSALHFSPLYIDGEEGVVRTMRLGAGAHDKHLYFYDLPNRDAEGVTQEMHVHGDEAFKNVLDNPFTFNKHSSAIINFDFNGDGSKFQSNCQAGELLYGDVIPGKNGSGHVKQITKATEMAQYNGVRDEDGDPNFWCAQTCTLGWPVQGIWPPGADTTDINSCDRSPIQDLLATVDDFGLLKLFRYPAVRDSSKFLQFEGHSSHATCVRWTMGEHLVTTGGNDKCVFVWHCERE